MARPDALPSAPFPFVIVRRRGRAFIVRRTHPPFVILRRSAAETGGRSGAEGDLFTRNVRRPRPLQFRAPARRCVPRSAPRRCGLPEDDEGGGSTSGMARSTIRPSFAARVQSNGPPFLSSSSGGAKRRPGDAAAPKAICSTTISAYGVRDRFALPRAAASPGLRREGAACRRMTKGGRGQPLHRRFDGQTRRSSIRTPLSRHPPAERSEDWGTQRHRRRSFQPRYQPPVSATGSRSRAPLRPPVCAAKTRLAGG